MAVSFVSNKKNTAATIHVSVANTTIKVSGNSTTTNVDSTAACLAVSDETLSGAYIAQAFWGIDPNGYARHVDVASTFVVVLFPDTLMVVLATET